ncbi:hypothetical protein [Estrella lausannensis]|uniref:Uncharacterized protein n=1 Tax=Estrella lausannensis TaxID=483423 RepID=A0A0H5E3H4_9BACT|nr:hypothetical protein [Estrella lausannensis]CRX37765.1 hypothetical protein ELAC_0404 [Estrella lausannensis]
MTFDSQDPFANGPFIIPVNGGLAPGDVGYEGPLSLQVNSKFESAAKYNGSTPLSDDYQDVILIEVPWDTQLNADLDALLASGDLILKKADGTLLSAADAAIVVDWLKGDTGSSSITRTLGELVNSSTITSRNMYESADNYSGAALTGGYQGLIYFQLLNGASVTNSINTLVANSTPPNPKLIEFRRADKSVITDAADIAAIVAWLGGTNTVDALVSSNTVVKELSGIKEVLPVYEANAHTIQRLIEVNYIREGNRILTNALTSLDDALRTTDNVLLTLSTIQNLHNKLTVKSPGALSFDYLSDQVADGVEATASAYASAYQKAASGYFGPPIYPDFMWSSATAIVPGLPSGGTFHQYAEELSVAKSNLGVYLAELLPKTPTNPPGQTPTPSNVDPNSLYAKSKIVYDNMDWSADGLPTFEKARDWALDKYDVYQTSGANAQEAGKLQQEITFAITAGQSLNDSLKEKVRRYMFVFEEYYKSASSMLSKISQLIEKMAQGLRPS